MPLQDMFNLNFLVPFTGHKLDFTRAIRGLSGMPRRLLLVGQKLTAGAAPNGAWQTVTTDTQAVTLYGEGSQLVAMWRAAKRNAQIGMQIDCLPLATASGSSRATWTLSLTNGAGATAAIGKGGTMPVYVEGVRIPITIRATDTVNTIAVRLHNAINALPDLPVESTTVPTAGDLSLRCKWLGETGNKIDLRVCYYVSERLPGQLSTAITVSAAGAGVPDITLSALRSALDGYRPTQIALGWSASALLDEFETLLDERWAENNMQDGQLLCAMRSGTLSDHTDWLAQRNSAMCSSIHTIGDMTSPWCTAAMAAARIESSAAIDPAVPYTGLELTGYLGASAGVRWDIDVLNTLLLAGGSPLRVRSDGTAALLRVVTNYTQTVDGTPDRSMSSLEQIKTASYWRYSVVRNFQVNYQGYKLAQYLDDPIPGQKIMTAELAEEIMIGQYKLFIEAGLMQHMSHYKDTLVTEVDGANGKLKIYDEPLLITQHYQNEITSAMIAGSL